MPAYMHKKNPKTKATKRKAYEPPSYKSAGANVKESRLGPKQYGKKGK